MATRGIVLCADDYGLAPGVGRAIRELVRLGRLSAVSCMTGQPGFDREGRALAEIGAGVDLGLHLTLARSDRVADALRIQLDAFAEVFRRPPDFIDGHRHVHLRRGVREHVVEAAARLGAWVRLTNEPIGAIVRSHVAPVKAIGLSLLGRPLAREVRRRGIAHNSGFRGARSFAERGPFGALFRRIVAGAREGTLVMCHPGLVDAELEERDHVTRPREEEFLYFSGGEFLADLVAEGLRLARMRELRPVAPGVDQRE